MQKVKKNAFWLDKKQDSMHIFEEILFFKATYNTKKKNQQFTDLLPVAFL